MQKDALRQGMKTPADYFRGIARRIASCEKQPSVYIKVEESQHTHDISRRSAASCLNTKGKRRSASIMKTEADDAAAGKL
ncbi:hypothetical protein PO124_09470 [Bacillus licheniformis]|nr:hypothetical protein [Bacillus licheniformis]